MSSVAVVAQVPSEPAAPTAQQVTEATSVAAAILLLGAVGPQTAGLVCLRTTGRSHPMRTMPIEIRIGRLRVERVFNRLRSRYIGTEMNGVDDESEWVSIGRDLPVF